MTRKIIFIVILLANIFRGWTQNKSIHFQHLTPENGLSQEHILCMLQDRDGFIWIGTYYGLNRYDGYSIKTYTSEKNDTNSLASSLIYFIFEDKEGYLWIGNVNGVDKYDKKNETFKHYKAYCNNNCLNDGNINCITQDLQGNIWIATTNGGINKIAYKTGKISYITAQTGNLPSNHINDLLYCSDNTLWIATESGLCKMNLLTGIINLFSSNVDLKGIPTCLFEDEIGLIWIGTNNGNLFITSRNKSSISEVNYMPEQYKSRRFTINDIVSDKRGNILIGTDGRGLVVYNHTKRKSYVYINDVRNPKSIASNEIRSLLTDRNKTVFVGTYGKGISKYSPFNNKFESYLAYFENPYQGENNSFTDCAEGKNGQLIIGSYNGFYVYDTANWTYKHFLPGNNYDDNKIITITIAPDSTIWMGTNRSVHRYTSDFKKIKSYLFSTDNLNHPVYTITFDHKNNLWLGLFINDGLLKIPENEWRNKVKPTFNFKLYKHTWSDTTTIGGDEIWHIKEDRHKKLWIANNMNISLYNKNADNFSQYNLTGLSKTLEFDENNNLIVTTRGEGFYIYNQKNGRYTQYTDKNGLCQNFVFGAVIDKQKNIWLTTENGLSRFNPKTKAFRNYDVDDGLPSNRFDDRSEKLLSNGMIYMGTSRGFILFNPESIKDDTSKAKIILTQIKIHNEPITYSFANPNNIISGPVEQISEITIKPSQRDNIQFEFTALHYSAPRKIQYQYMLEGFDNDWITTDALHRNARYTNLTGGTYYFKVKATNSDGIWNETPFSLKVIVNPPFYKTVTFLICTIAFILGLLILFFKHRIKKEIKHSEKLEELVHLRTSELSEQNIILENKTNSLKKANKQLKEKQKAIEQQKEQLAEQHQTLTKLNQTKDKLFSIIAHDLRNPFNVILGFTKLLLNSSDNYDKTRKEKILNLLHQSAQSAHLLLENLLNWTRTQNGNLAFEPENMILGEIFKEALQQVTDMAKLKNITISMENNFLNEIVEVDLNMIQAVLRNLLSNAIKFSENGNKIIIRTEKNDTDKITIVVQDFGTGMPQEILQNLFNPQNTNTNAGTAGEKGTGLGLIICKEFVDKHNGAIWAESEPGKGTSFYFTVPCGTVA